MHINQSVIKFRHRISTSFSNFQRSLFWVVLVAGVVGINPLQAQVWINELHYDNDGADTGEAVEVAGAAGTNLAGWTIALYNGSPSQLNVYDTINLSGTIPDEGAGYGTLSFARAGIQNGSPDGLALVDNTPAVVQFLSYEGDFTAGSGPASGMASTDIGVSEPSNTPTGHSLQLTGTGTAYADFTWQPPMASTFGSTNTGQVFSGVASVPELLLSELVVTPTAGEFIEIHNPGSSAVDLSNVYLTDATFAPGGTYYYNIVTGANAGGGGFGDFHARFPDGASIPAGGYQTVALAGSDDFFATYGVNPTYELFEDGAADGIADMREAFAGSINNQGGLTNSGEVVVLYSWDGASDLVQDLDYALWGDKDEAVDKTGVATDGPDGDSDTSSYQADTAIASQDVIAGSGHSGGSSFSRDDLAEGSETQTGGNGVNGDDETSENLSVTWRSAPPSPNAETPPPVVELTDIIITEIMQNPAAVSDGSGEWFELYNSTDADIDLNGWTIADNDSDSHVINNGSPLVIPAGAYLVLGNNADSNTNGGAPVAYSYGSDMFLSNSSDELIVLDGGLTEVDRVEWDNGATFPDPTGASMSLAALNLDNALGENWCTSVTPFGIGDRGTPGSENSCVAVIPPFGACGDPATPIYNVQGSGTASGYNGIAGVILEGVVVGDFQQGNQLNGFFLQEEDSQADGNPATSDGIFVFDNGFGPDVVPGDVVRVQGTVTEFFDLTELNVVTDLANCGPGGIASATVVNLPMADLADWERLEGMLVSFPQTLYATDNFTWARFGEVGLAVDGPLDNPTNVVLPGAAANALQAANNLRRIQLDDGSTVQNPLPLPPYLGAGNTLRVGDSVTGLTGVLSYGFGSYELQPTAPVNFVRENLREETPPDVGGSLIRVAGFNVLNYFIHLDNGGNICGPAANMQCRGADNLLEFNQQKSKLVAALTTLDADVVGVIEIENAADDAPIADLVDGLNAVAGAGTYAYIATGAIGTDAIRVGIIYKPAEVSPVGGYETLDSADDPAFLDDKNRPSLAQTFAESSTGERFTVVVNHLKSKGSNCNDVADPDTGDGQGNCNGVRAAAAAALVDWLATDPTGSGDPDFLILGDLNSYALEDPIAVIEGGGYTDLIKALVGSGWSTGAYSYAFQGQLGYLDYALSSGSLLPEVSGAAAWHINSDEPAGLDYNDHNQPLLFNADPWRASDHDAVVVGLYLDADEDGVWDAIDHCPGTVIPESVPTLELGTNSFALTDDDGVFDTTPSKGKGPQAWFDIFDTAGCSCEQIIAAQELGEGHSKYGCSLGEMKEWVEWVNSP